jgi:hypothetical protein
MPPEANRYERRWTWFKKYVNVVLGSGEEVTNVQKPT